MSRLCRKCGKQFGEGKVFCGKCGAKLRLGTELKSETDCQEDIQNRVSCINNMDEQEIHEGSFNRVGYEDGCPKIVKFGSVLATIIGYCTIIIGVILAIGVFNAHDSLTDGELSNISMMYDYFLKNVVK